MPLALLLALPVAFFAGHWQSQRQFAERLDQARVQAEQLQLRSVELEQLRRQLAVTESGAQLARQAGEQNRQTIKLLEEQVFQLQQELATYREVLAPDSSREGLRIRAFQLQSTEDPRRFRFQILLSRVGPDEPPLAGLLQVELRGRQGGRNRSLPLTELSEALPAEGLPFAFRHFQAIPEGGQFAELVLPEGFEPLEVVLRARVEGQRLPLERSFRWAELR
ncbi:hypothetical protein NGA35_16350 [Pseudomonas stutzeri]|nr:hypothetical protein [Stutzerimonas stutzeri]